MRNRFLLLFLFICGSLFAQKKIIRGTVYNEKGPFQDVAVYFNNSMIGTATNKKGEFSIPVIEGNHQLIVSFLGFKTITYNLDTKTYSKPLVFALVEDENMLDEIIIGKTKYDDDWKYNLTRFKQEFIGRTELAKDCEILNPKVLYFEYEAEKKKLTAFARAPLKIRNKGLGYKITYDLKQFIIEGNRVEYLGFSKYENLKGNKRKQRKWEKNRLKAYNGSATHFYKTLLNKSTYKEGFIVNQFKRIPNQERPTEKEIKKARELVRLSKSMINFSKKIDAPITAIDSALLVLRKVRLPKFKDYLYRTKVPGDSLISIKSGFPYLDFKNNLSVIYTKEKEEKGFILRNMFSKKRKPLPQTSSLIPLSIPTMLNKRGLLLNPLDMFFEGYWSYEKFADSLPLDYIPTKN